MNEKSDNLDVWTGLFKIRLPLLRFNNFGQDITSYSTHPIKRTVLLSVLFEKIWNIPIKCTVHKGLETISKIFVLSLLNVLFIKKGQCTVHLIGILANQLKL